MPSPSLLSGAVDVLTAFDADHTEWRLSELSRHLGVPTSTLHEQLLALCETGLLLRAGRGRYRLGWRLLKLSSALYGSLPWYGPAHAAMERAARAGHCLAFLSVLDAASGRVLCIARSVQGRDGPPVAGELDFELPAHASASGKLLLALAGRPLPPGSPAFTPHTLTDAAAWEAEAARIRAQDAVVTRDEWASGTSGLAAPVRDATGTVLAALGLSVPTPRLRGETLLRALRDEADAVSWALGWRPG
ncbi:IclR family transcriptional regulator [Deinococcus arenae]|uniref:IclR family transcriptional regulator n=1 Tax=Deinococcus arenae TaxID=1452751 RepID=A0A8H9L4H2_9DEIO|nr:IclR family transcriptional regulator [Deinococcus arenae]AWT35657.1 IclR family transcriptional regulator [Deinococcus actinosclerus]GGM32939.1 IclR family transcriptional regulator [Deinococcus arenae]